MSTKYTVGPDINLDQEEIYEPDGTRLTEARSVELAQETLRALRGRPSLTQAHEHSPRLSVRLPANELHDLTVLAHKMGVPVSTLARQAIEDFLLRAS